MKGRSILLVAALALVVTATAAQPRAIDGTSGNDNINGTQRRRPDLRQAGNSACAFTGYVDVSTWRRDDVVRSGPGQRRDYAGDGNDVTWPGGGADIQYSVPERHLTRSRTTIERDVLDCGRGYDVASDPERPGHVPRLEQVIRSDARIGRVDRHRERRQRLTADGGGRR